MSCEICDRNEYHQNDWHCSNGLIGPKIKEWFDIDSDDEEEDPIKCDKCNTNTYRSHQEYPDTWQYNYMAFCKDCQKEMNEDSEEDDERWNIRPSGDFPICLYCDRYCEIVSGKFAKTCGKCENSDNEKDDCMEPCDRCPSKDISWCESNGCSTEEEIKEIEETYFKPEKKQNQYNSVCDEEGCDKVLCIDTPIMCYRHNHNGDKTLCRTCYEDGDYKEDDENSDNYDSEDEE